MRSLRKRRRRRHRRRRRRHRCSTSPSTASSTPASAPDASACTTWRGAVSDRGSASAADHGCAHEVHPRRLWLCQCRRSCEIRGRCADGTTGGCACLRARSQEEFVEAIQFIPQERMVYVGVPSAAAQVQTLEVAKNISQERVQWRRGADRGMPVPQIMSIMWR